VRICARAEGHVQCTGYDARGRKQYRYHPSFRRLREEAKYEEVLEFAAELPQLRKAIERDLAAPRLTKAKVVATILGIMDLTSLRVGNDRYMKENGSFGLTTLEDAHARIVGPTVSFSFRGKGGKAYRAAVRDRKLAAIVKRCRDIPGQRLFQYEDELGRHHAISSTDVNAYIRAVTGRPFTAKAFRTWSATVHATVFLAQSLPGCTVAERKRNMLAAIDKVADHLGNTRAICRKCYVHPLVTEAYEGDQLTKAFARCLGAARTRAGLRREECAVLELLGELSRSSVRAAA
jgi:DNA topoisomerase-1